MRGPVLDRGGLGAEFDDGLLGRLLSPLSDAVLLLDEAGRIALLNPAAERLFGYDPGEALGREWRHLIPRGLGRSLGGIEPDGPDMTLHGLGRRRDGLLFEAGFLLGAMRMGERRLRRLLVRETSGARQEDHHHWSRLTLLGKLAPSLAHELAQPLATLTHLAASCREILSSGGAPNVISPAEILDEIGSQAARAGDLVRALRAFALGGAGARAPESVAKLVADARRLALPDSEARGIRVDVAVDPGLEVLVDRVLIQQALVNLLRNAAEGMVGRPRRELAVRGRRRAERWAEIRVEDTGPGLPPHLAARLFMAPFTTKPDGLGLGLSICKDIVEAHGGSIWLENRPPHGATFAFTLPLVVQV
ncbi:sensor histidine kinase [Rubellimicrobium roseum]|nr:ATP-binding protein [Rubellimicrobium roseum]